MTLLFTAEHPFITLPSTSMKSPHHYNVLVLCTASLYSLLKFCTEKVITSCGQYEEMTIPILFQTVFIVTMIGYFLNLKQVVLNIMCIIVIHWRPGCSRKGLTVSILAYSLNNL